jgi:iron complex outermembrane receptor protein
MAYRRNGVKSVLASSASALVIAVMTANTGVALAQDGEEGTSDVIIVTATKREESIQEVPLAITALTGDFTRAVNLNDVKDIILWTPGFTGNSQDSFIDAVSVRGILTNDFGVGGDPSVGFFKNNLFQGRNGVAVTSLYDMERAEALRGPQGFLFGRNAIGGAISVHTRRPDIGSDDGYIEIDIGERGRRTIEGGITASGTSSAGRLAGYFSTEDGWIDNVGRPGSEPLLGHEKWGVRFSSVFEEDNLDGFFFVEYENRDQDGTAYRAIEGSIYADRFDDLFGLSLGGDGRDVDQDMSGYGGINDDSQIWNAGLELNMDLGFATLTSMTGYQSHSYNYIEDYDGTPYLIADYFQDQSGSLFQQELRMTSSGDGPLSWYAGASYYSEDIDAFFEEKADEGLMCAYYFAQAYPSYYPTGASALAGCQYYYGDPLDGELVESNRAIGDYSGWAAYVNLNYQITEALDVGLGLRYSVDNKDFSLEAFDVDSPLGPYYLLGFTTDEPIRGSDSWDAFTPQFVTRYRLNDDTMVFASATRGFKAGGFGSFSVQEHPGQPEIGFGALDLTNADARPDDFDPETAWSYEIGIKGEVADGRIRYDVNAFSYTYDDLQLVVIGSGGGTRVDNVGHVTGQGFEAAVDITVSDYFDIRLSGAHASTELSEAQAICPGDDPNACEGNGLSHVPDLSGAASFSFHYPSGGGEILAAADIYMQTDTSALSASTDPAELIPGYTDVSLRFGYESDRGWAVIGYVENVTDELYYDGIFAGGGITPAVYFNPSRPRTVGVRFSSTFGGN